MIELNQPTAPTTHDMPKASTRALHFPTQRPDEHVFIFLRRHWSVLARQISHVCIFLFLPPIALAITYAIVPFEVIPGSLIYIVLVEGISLYYLFTLLAYFHAFIDYHLDIWIVTDQRVISIEQQGLFNRVVSELNIGRVQDVTSEMKGKLQTFMHFGQVHIQTAGEEERFIFEQVPKPDEVARLILQVHDRVAKTQELEKVREEEDYRKELDGRTQNAPTTELDPKKRA